MRRTPRRYLNNRLEADHGRLKRLINPTRGFKTLPTASATIKGFEMVTYGSLCQRWEGVLGWVVKTHLQGVPPMPRSVTIHALDPQEAMS
jgi:hypothetical protein